jgi:hypothetical protein
VVFLERLDIGQKTGLLAAAAVFIAAQITLTLTLTSKGRVEAETRALNAEALLNAVASRTAGLVASDDMLTATSELNKLLASEIVGGAAISDVDGEFLVVVGSLANKQQQYRAPLRIGPDIAGQLTVQLEDVTFNSSLRWTVSSFSLVLAMFSYAGAVSIARSQSRRLRAVLERIAHSSQVDDRLDALAQIETAIDELPLDLITPSSSDIVDDTSLNSMAVTTISLDHLGRYIDTVDEITLANYVGTYEALAKAVAQLLDGDLQTVRPESLTLFFEGTKRGMTPDARAVIAGTLMQHLLAVAERSQRRKFICGIGVGRSDMGRGERGSAYATLYNQTVFDETLTVAQRAGSSVKLAPSILGSGQVEALFDVVETADGDTQLGAATPALMPELDKQSKLLQRRLFPDVGEQPDLPF